MLKPGGQIEGDEALEFYAKHTAQIEVQGSRWLPGGVWGGNDPLRKEPLGRKTMELNTGYVIRDILIKLTTCVWTVIFDMRIYVYLFFYFSF